MAILYFLESLRNPVFDFLFSAFTALGDETIFMVLGMIVFWCIDKYQGYYLLTTGFLGTAINQFLKMLFRIPRPWVKHQDFTIVEAACEGAAGYSFPSGHTQTAVGAYGGVARWNKNLVVRILAVCACVIVPLSRMYLGVHTPLDVGVSILIALGLVFGFYPLFRKAVKSPRTMYILLGSIAGVTLLYLLFAELYPFPQDTDPHNLESAVKNGYTLVGCTVGLLFAYTVDLLKTHFPTKAVWWAQIIKVVGGIALVLLVKEGLRVPIDWICGGHMIGRAVRYYLMVVVGGVLWPMTFRWFSKMGKKKKGSV